MLVFPTISNVLLELAMCEWVSNTVARNIAGTIARCGCPLLYIGLQANG